MTTYRFDPAKVAKLAKGEVAVEHTMKSEDLPMLSALLHEAFPKDTRIIGPYFGPYFFLTTFCKNKDKWGFDEKGCEPHIPILPLHSFLMEEEIEGWELVKKTLPVIRAISALLNRYIGEYEIDLKIHHHLEIKELRNAGVLELWFKPIYKKREEPKEQPINFPAMTTQEAANWIKTFMDCTKLQVLEEPQKYVPLQKCPVCEGGGRVDNPYSGSSSVPTSPCDVCNGSKVIPMHKVKE